MSELYGDDDSFGGAGSDRLIPDGLRRMIGAALFLGVVAAMGLWAYRLGTRDAAEVPIIRAMEGPVRIQPEDPGGLRAAHQGLEVNSVLAGRPENASPAGSAGAPLTAAPTLLAEEDGPQGELVIAEPAPLVDVEMSPDADLRMPLDDGALAEASAPAAVAPAETAAEPDAPVVDATSLAALVEAAVEPQAAESGPRPLRRPANLPRARAAAPAAATAAASPAAAAPAAAPAAREVASPSRGSRMVQLGAYDSEANTRAAWNQLVARYGDLLGSKNLYIERTTANARVFYRLRVAGFENTDQTREMCEALRARGVDCIPVTLQ